ncbi:MAG: competence protein CoiA family protein [Simkaniaceae bacterium]
MSRLKFNAHFEIQSYLLQLLEGAQKECVFPKINRIADIFFENKVFEIQVSPISTEEVQNRIVDYESQGLKVFWLLHERSFNKKILNLSEGYLREVKKAYFVRTLPGQDVFIYDQHEEFDGRRRIYASPPLPIDLTHPTDRGFKGDLSDRNLLFPSSKKKKFNFKKAYLNWLNQAVIHVSLPPGEDG